MKLKYILLSENSFYSDDKTLNIIKVIDGFESDELPIILNFYLTYSLEIKNGEYIFGTKIKGNKKYIKKTKNKFEIKNNNLNCIQKFDLIFTKFGKYVVEIYVDGKLVGETDFNFKQTKGNLLIN